MSSASWQILSEFLIFLNLFHEPLDDGRVKIQHNMRNKKNICKITQGCRAMNSLSLMKKMDLAC